VSGFAGIVRMAAGEETAEADRVSIDGMAQAIVFRGPDALQQTQLGDASLAFSFLRTGPVTQESSQPCTVDGGTWFLGDVRCDGRDDLKIRLAQHGVPLPDTASSEQLILHAFLKFGTAVLPELHGDFSFVLWKPSERRLLAFRDLTGARPFFYSYRSGVFCFSNTLQALFCHPSVSRRDYDEQSIGDFLLGLPHHDPQKSIYRDIRRLPPGYLLEFSPEGFSVRRIAHLPVEDLLQLGDEREVIAEFRELFTQAVGDRLPESDTSILLSGGLDSTSIAAAVVSLRKLSDAASSPKLHALCVDFQPLFEDMEGHYASRFAEAFGIPLDLVHSGDCLPFGSWDTLASSLPEPLTDPYSLLYLSYRKKLSRKARVLLSGDGGDEVLRLQAAPYLRYLLRRHGPLAALGPLARWMLSHRALPPLGFGLRSGFLRLFGHKPAELMYPPWFDPGFERSCSLSERWAQMCSPPPAVHPFNPKAYHALNDGLFGDVQEFCDPVWTGVPQETRNPFLDRRLCRFLLRIPVIPWAMNKELIRASQVGVLPEEIRLRLKTPVRQDPLVLHVASGRWNPVPAEAPATLVESAVNWRALVKSLERASGTDLYVHLRPVALSTWLNAVEKDGGIK